MCDIISEFCDVCCRHINKNKNNNDTKTINIFFSNEDTYDIIYNKITVIHKIYYDDKYTHIDVLISELMHNKFNIKKNHTKNITYIDKDDCDIQLINKKYLEYSTVPHKNIYLDIERKELIINNGGNNVLNKIDNLDEYLTYEKKRCIELVIKNKEYIFEFIYIFLRWESFFALEIIEYFKKMLNESKIRAKVNKFFDTNIKHTTTFLSRLENLEESQIKLFAELMETKFNIFNEPFYMTKHVRLYGYNITNVRQYVKFVCFSKFIKIDMNYFKSEITKITEPNIEIPSYNLCSMKVNNNNYSVSSKLEKVDLLMTSGKDVTNLSFITSMADNNLRMSLSVFYQTCKAYFAVDTLGDDISTLKYAYICKKSQIISKDEFIENINILSKICDELGLNNKITSDSFIYYLNNNKTVNKYELLSNKAIPGIIKNKNKYYDMYDHQKFYYLLLEEIYLNKYEGYNFEESDNLIYEKIMDIITNRLIEEKDTIINYLRTGCSKHNLFSDNDNNMLLDSVVESSSYELDFNVKIDSIFDNYFDDDDDKKNIDGIFSACEDIEYASESSSDSDSDSDSNSNIESNDNNDSNNKEMHLINVEKELEDLKKTNDKKITELVCIKLEIINKLTKMSNFETKLLEGIDIKYLSENKINEILEYYEII